MRWRVAEHKNTPTRVLTALAADPDNTVRLAVARNATEKLLVVLAEDTDPKVRHRANLELKRLLGQSP